MEIKKQLTKKDVAVLLTIIFIGLAVLNFLASRHFLRLDLTENRQYTLADSTKNLLKGLNDIITIRVYFTEATPPALAPIKKDLKDVLSEYKSYAGSKLRIEYRDPSGSPQMEREATMLGIAPVQVNVIEKDKRELAKVYLGLAILFGDKKDIIPLVDSPDNLEYELTAAIIGVTTKELPQIGWWAPSAKEESSGTYDTFLKSLQSRYVINTITEIKPNTLDPRDLPLVVLVSPKNLKDDEKFALDQYIVGGGKLIALIDTIQITSSLQTTVIDSGLKDLFKHYGAWVDDKLVADRANSPAAFSGGFMTYQIPYPFWVKAVRENLDTSYPAIAKLESVTFPWTSPIELTEPPPDGIERRILAKATPYAALTDISPSPNLMPDNANSVLDSGGGASKDLAVLLQGIFSSAYGSGGLTPPKGAKPADKGLAGQILLVGNSRLIQDTLIRQFQESAMFIDNNIDFMAMGDALIGIRTRTQMARPLTAIPETAKVSLRWANTFGTPIILVGLGLIIWWIRRQRHHALQLAYRISPINME